MGIGRALCAATALFGIIASGSADAQRYYAREKLLGYKGAEVPKTGCQALVARSISSGGLTGVGDATTSADALRICEANFASRGPGSCTWVQEKGYSDTNKVLWSSTASYTPYPSNLAVWATVCK